MFILKVKNKSIDRQNVENEIAEKTCMPFKLGTIVNDIPIWLEAQIPYSPNEEEMLCIYEMIKHAFSETAKLLEEKNLRKALFLKKTLIVKPSKKEKYNY